MKICIPLRASKSLELTKKMKVSEKIGDIIEIWFDDIKKNDSIVVADIFKKCKKPVIYKYLGKQNILEKVLKFKPAYIDIDIKTKREIVEKIRKQSKKTKIIVSYHNFNSTPKDKQLDNIAETASKMGADIVKIATYSKSHKDSFRMLQFLEKLTSQNVCSICLCMGKKGRITRICGHLFGNYLTYAPLNINEKTAEGQLSASELKKLINKI